jgi:hypothetical protein
MEILNIEIVNPEAKALLMNLAEMNLIHIRITPSFAEMLTELRKNEKTIPSSEEINEEVEIVRQARYEKKNQSAEYQRKMGY